MKNGEENVCKRLKLLVMADVRKISSFRVLKRNPLIILGFFVPREEKLRNGF